VKPCGWAPRALRPEVAALFALHSVASLAGLFVALHVAVELAWRAGLRRRGAREDEISTEPAGAMLALLGLLLGFSVSLAVDRFDARKQLVIEEANAIGTAELRARLLPEPASSQSRALYAQYLDRRLEWGEAAGDEASQRRLASEAGEIQARLWRLALDGAASTPAPIVTFYAGALNEVIDREAERAQMRLNRVPETVLLLLAATTLLANALFAGVLGRNARKRTLDLHALAFATWLVIALIVDLDQPRRGWVQISQEPLRRLQADWADPTAPRSATDRREATPTAAQVP